MRYSPAALRGGNAKIFENRANSNWQMAISKLGVATLSRFSQHGVEWGHLGRMGLEQGEGYPIAKIAEIAKIDN